MGREPAAENREYLSGRLIPVSGLLVCLGLLSAVAPAVAAQVFIEELIPKNLTPALSATPTAPTPPPPASSGAMVAFNDSFTDEAKVASGEGVTIFHGNVTLSGRVGNPGFEGDGGWGLRTRGNYTGAIQSLWAAEGIRAYRLYSPADKARTAGNGVELLQAANFTGANELQFTYRTSPRAPYHTLSVVAAGPNQTPPLPNITLWSRTFDPAGRSFFENESVKIVLPGSLQGTLDLIFRLETSANFSSGAGANASANASGAIDVGVEIDDVRLLPKSTRSRGSLTSILVETAPIVSATGTINATGDVGLQVSNDGGATWENVTWGQPVWFATSGRSFRYRLELRSLSPGGGGTSSPLPPSTGPPPSPSGNATGNASRPVPTEVYDVRFALETSSQDFSAKFPRTVKVSEPVQVQVEPDGLRYFFLAFAPNGLPLNLTRNATAFSFTPALNGTYLLDIRATTLPGAKTQANASKRFSIGAVANGTPPSGRPPELQMGAAAAVIRVYATPGAKDYPVEIQYAVESGRERLSPGVVGGKVQPEGSTEFSIGLGNLQVGPGSYQFAVRVVTPDGAYDLRAPLTITGIAGQSFSLVLPVAGGAAAAGGFVFYWFFWRKRKAAAKEKQPGEGEAFDAAAVQASMDAAAADGVLPSESTYVEPPPPFVGIPPVRLARIAEGEIPPPPVIQAEIPQWTLPTPPPAEPEFPSASPEGLDGLLRQKESLAKELREMESYSATLGGSKSADEVRQALEGRREMRSRLRRALDTVETRILALRGGGAAPTPVPEAAPAPVPEAAPARRPTAPAPRPQMEPPPPPPDADLGFESPFQAEIDKIEADLKRKKGSK